MKIIAGNWKMNGTRAGLANMLCDLENVDSDNTVILCVPYTMLRAGNSRVAIGAQDVSAHTHGAFTGEVSAKMIADAGAKYVIVGHSECRFGIAGIVQYCVECQCGKFTIDLKFWERTDFVRNSLVADHKTQVICAIFRHLFGRHFGQDLLCKFIL